MTALIRFVQKEKGSTLKNVRYHASGIPDVGDRVTFNTSKGPYNYVVISRRFVFTWRKLEQAPDVLEFIEITLEKIK